MTTGGKKDHKEQTAIAALLTASTIAEAAKAAGISKQTLWRWLQEPEFKEQYMEARKQAISQAIAQLQASTGQAVTTLNRVMNDSKAPAHSQISAAKTVLEFAFKGFEMQETLARIEALEQGSGKGQGGQYEPE